MKYFRLVKSGRKLWFSLAVLWGLWYFAIFTFGGEKFIQLIIWGGALLAGGVTLPLFLRTFHWSQLPLEVKLLSLFWLWSLTGVLVAVDFELFTRYSRLVLQFTLIVLFISFIIANSGAVKPLFAGFVAVGAGLVLYHVSSLGTGISLESTQSLDRVAEANAVGFRSVMGIMGGLALYPETRAKTLRLMLVLAGLLALYGVVLSASRGALVALFLVFALWPLFCFKTLFRSKLIAAGIVVIIGILGYFFYDFVIDQTNLGRRFSKMENLEDNSTLERLELFWVSFKIFLDYPLFGAGLGQFPIASGRDLYAHNELGELIGTTGLIGTLIYFYAYFVTWRRLQRCARILRDPLILYRIHFAQMSLIVLILSGLMFRPNFLSQDTMFLYAYIVGVSLWARRLQPSRKMPPAAAHDELPVTSAPFPGYRRPA